MDESKIIKKRVFITHMENRSGYWCYIETPQFYLETKEYSTPAIAVKAIKRLLNQDTFEIVKD